MILFILIINLFLQQNHATAVVFILPHSQIPLLPTLATRPSCLQPCLERSSSYATSRPSQQLPPPLCPFSFSFFSLSLIFVFYREGSRHGTTPPPWSSPRLRPTTSPSASICPPRRWIHAGAAVSAAQTTNQELPLACPAVGRRTTERSTHSSAALELVLPSGRHLSVGLDPSVPPPRPPTTRRLLPILWLQLE